MKGVQKPLRTITSIAITSLMISNHVNAGSFSLYTESSPRAIGNYAAGIAAEAADAATGWYNPAGLVLLHKQQILVGAVGILPRAAITGISTYTMGGLPNNYVQNFSNLNGLKNALVPSIHYALPLGERAAFGISVVAPFGLATNWSNTSPVRYEATASNLYTTNVSPELGGRLSENLAVGVGVDLQYASVKFNSVIGAPNLMQDFAIFGVSSASFVDSISYNQGNSFAVGFHAGVMLLFNDEHTRIGLNFQSPVRHKFNGFSRLTGRLADPTLTFLSPESLLLSNPRAVFESRNLTSNSVSFPPIVTLSTYHDLSDRLAVLGSIVYTGWGSFKTIQLNNVAAFAPTGVVPGQANVVSISPQFYANVWRFSVGANYTFNEQWELRAGTGFDQTPTTNAWRDIRVPDANRWALSVGGHYQLYSPMIGFDLGYTHLFTAGNSNINRTDIIGTHDTFNVTATSKGHADLVGLQATWTIDAPKPIPTK